MSCGANIVKELTKKYNVTLYFYNPNIFPKYEYNKRLNEVKKISKQFNYNLITEDYNHNYWKNLIKGHESDKEGEDRCKICYTDRLKKTRNKANKLKFNYFTTTLTISPHKKSSDILEIGLKLEKTNYPNFLNQNFKKDNGYLKATILAKKLGLYRQNYCGCEFSIN